MKRLAATFTFLCMTWTYPGWAADDRLVLTGSSTVAPLALEIAK
jgi:hypothetical protein